MKKRFPAQLPTTHNVLSNIALPGSDQAIRRSIKGEKEKPHISIPQKSALAIVPPKKVIRALYDYEAQGPGELSFSRGDFFHVIGRENDPEWYEACNPALPDARGLVPVAFFQALGRTERDSAQSQPDSARSIKHPDHDSGYGEAPAASPPPAPAPAKKKASAMVYGVVMYDFHAERADELEAKAGEAIIVIAQSNPEWFVAKPIGRLGGPGLIPVSFVEIRDMVTNKPVENPQEAVRKAGIPKVEEWKRMAAEYKNSSITLGKFESNSSKQPVQQQLQQQQQQQQRALEQSMERMSLGQSNGHQSHSSTSSLKSSQAAGYTGSQANPLPAPVFATIPRYCFAEDKYWFIVVVEMEDGRAWELSRYYEDFYDFQIALLSAFPVEAGTTGQQQRTLPYMPGPVNYVTDAITEGRRYNLDAYVKNLLAQPPHISRCDLVRTFFQPREGDIEIDPQVLREEYRVSGASRPSSTESPADAASRQSSRQNLHSNGSGYSSYTSRQQPSVSRQVSSLSQPSQSSLSPGAGIQPQPGAQMKVKLSYNGELIAIKVPSDISFRQLYDRIVERLKIPPGEQPQLSYKDEPTGDKPPLMSDYDLEVALSRNEKLLLYVE